MTEVREGQKVRYRYGGPAQWTVGPVSRGYTGIKEWGATARAIPVEGFWDDFELLQDVPKVSVKTIELWDAEEVDGRWRGQRNEEQAKDFAASKFGQKKYRKRIIQTTTTEYEL